ncbi:beta-galactosidase-like [Branchiostoma lanceolatum]|uniref:beta-galactosidase-like n=1 Tax=Branchiostoma lanceolatum TaxID=7740 RepID=UPI003454F8C6
MAATTVKMFVALSLVVLVLLGARADGRSFSIDYDNNTFLKDGEPFRYISGSIHYSRVPRSYWQDRLTKMYAAGLNAIQVYVPWNLHEPKPGKYDFTGNNDIEAFLKMAHDTGLLVILRPGPYICAEWDMGGLPSWLMKDNSSIVLRSSDPAYLGPVDTYMAQLLPRIKPLLYNNGGPVITVQVENEYGSFYTCDYDYLRHLRELFLQLLGPDVILFTTDGWWDGVLKCGTIDGLYTTVDFGPGTDIAGAFHGQRKHQPKGPLVNSEYYTGWLDHWGQPHAHTDKDKVATYLEKMLQMNASVNMYMFEGGTNFGYMNGANGPFKPQPTSYDYDAPLTEAGDPTNKLTTISNVIAKFRQLPPGPVPPATPKAAYGKVQMTFEATVLDKLSDLSPDGPIRADHPITMENMQQSYGFMLYRTTLPTAAKGVKLSVPGIRDRGFVMLDQTPAGILSRNGPMDLNITVQAGQVLDIVVENQGRINFGRYINDSKGIIANVTLGNDTLRSWDIYSLSIDGALPTMFSQPSNPAVNINDGLPALSPALQQDIEGIDGELTNQEKRSAQPQRSRAGQMVPSFYTGKFSIQDTPQDTFLNMKGWTKGQAFVNGFNLGRYWPVEGPQITLYVPASVLKSDNNITLFELEASPCGTSQSDVDCTVEFQDRPIINATVSRRRGEKHDSATIGSAPSEIDAFTAVVSFVSGVVFSVAYPISTVLNIIFS